MNYIVKIVNTCTDKLARNKSFLFITNMQILNIINTLHRINTPPVSFGKKIPSDTSFQKDNTLQNDVFIKSHNKLLEKYTAKCHATITTKYGSIVYGDKGFSYFEFEKPQSLQGALKRIKYLQKNFRPHYGIITHNYIYKGFDDAFSKKFKKDKFVRYLGSGGSSIAIEREDGKVLKLSVLDPFYFNRPIESFDAKLFEKGENNNYHYCIQEKCSQKEITDEHVEVMREQIEKNGYKATDLSQEQIGFGQDGMLYLIDPECAINESDLEESKKENEEWMRKYGLDLDYI